MHLICGHMRGTARCLCGLIKTTGYGMAALFIMVMVIAPAPSMILMGLIMKLGWREELVGRKRIN